MTKATRFEHYVPQSYLRNFSIAESNQNVIYCFDKITGKKFRRKISRVAGGKNFYGERSGTQDDIETYLGGMESAFGPACRKLFSINDVRPEYLGREPPFDKFLLGRKLVDPYFFSHHSALEVHGIANSAAFSAVYLSSPKQFQTKIPWDRLHVGQENRTLRHREDPMVGERGLCI